MGLSFKCYKFKGLCRPKIVYHFITLFSLLILIFASAVSCGSKNNTIPQYDVEGLYDYGSPYSEDTDGDGVFDESDNCVEVSNEDQADIDGDGVGDLCDPDIDNDEVMNENDNCPEKANTEQLDVDNDLIGDACDLCSDADGDGVGNGDNSNQQCESAAADVDDNDPNVCVDVDSDGCDDCSTGIYAPSNDGDDFDKDGFCDIGDPYSGFNFRNCDNVTDELNRSDIHVDINGDIWISDAFANNVILFDDEGNELMNIGSYGTELGEFYQPNDISVGRDNYLYIVDTSNHRVQVIDYLSDTIVVTLSFGKLDSEPGGLNFPRGIEVTPEGVIYVADTVNHRLQAFDSAGNNLFVIGEEGSSLGQMSNPVDVAVDVDGYIYVAERSNYRVQVFDPQKQTVMIIDAESLGLGEYYVFMPVGVDTDNNGNIYVLDQAGSRVVVIDVDGNVLRSVGEEGNALGQFQNPTGLHVNKDAKVYVSDKCRLQIF